MNQKVLVTAGAAGSGLEIVKAFAATGATVFVCDINETALKELSTASPIVSDGKTVNSFLTWKRVEPKL